MSDLISRQAAIDALDVLCQEHRYKIPGKGETYSQYNEAWQDALDRAEGAIFNLPPAQPETHDKRTETHGVCLDAISRQQAIDALWAERMKHDEEMERNLETCSFALRADNKARRNRVEEDIEIIRQLPPAQPKRGKWIPSDTDGFVCSVCRNGYKNQPTLMGKPMFEFCPVCGAKMEVTE